MAVAATDNCRLVICPSEHEAVCVTLSRAFQSEEACGYIFPNPATRQQRLLKMFRIMIKSDAAAGSIYQTSGGEAATLWRAPGQATASVLNFAASLVPFLFALRGGIGRGLEISNAIERHHPKSPFWYLHFVGCDPLAQGKGFGGTAIRAGLARADADHQPAYLETASPRNLPLYAGLGFVVQDEWQIAGGPKFWGMLRPAR